MNTHLADEPIEVKMLIEVQVGETLTSLALLEAPPHITPLLLY